MNGQSRGKTKDGKLALGSLEKGTYKLEVRHPDYAVFAKSITVNAGRSDVVPAILQPNFGYVVLPNIKQDAALKVDVDGKPIADPQKNLQFKGTELYIRVSPPGEHTVKIMRGTRTVYPTKKLIVTADAPKVEVPEPETATLIVQADPAATGQVFVDGVRYAKDLNEKGTVEINELTPDEPHKIQIENAKFKPYEQVVTPTTEKNLILKAELEELVEFFDNFDTPRNAEKWNAPPEWKFGNFALQVRGNKKFSPGLVKGIGFRDSYAGFNFKLGKGNRISWILRAEDEKNFYVCVLTAPPNEFAKLDIYVCRDGNIDWNAPVKTETVFAKLEKDKSHEIRIKVESNQFNHFLTPNESPDSPMSIGLFQDSKNLFPFGGVGFATLGDEEFTIFGGFTVCPGINPCTPQIKADPSQLRSGSK